MQERRLQFDSVSVEEYCSSKSCYSMDDLINQNIEDEYTEYLFGNIQMIRFRIDSNDIDGLLMLIERQ